MNASNPISNFGLNSLNSLNSPQDLGQFDLLYPERKYLLTTLRSQIKTVTELLQKIPPLEEALASNEQPHLRRSKKKQLGWLRCQVKEATRQEKAILTQLNQIDQKIQSKEMFKQAQHQQWQQEQHVQAWSNPHMMGNEIRPTDSVRLNPLSTEFVPYSNAEAYLNGSAQRPQQDGQLVPCLNDNTTLPKSGFSSMDEPFKLSKDEPLRYYRTRVHRPPMSKRRSSSMDDGQHATNPSDAPKHQIHSLPITPNNDETNKERAQGGKEFGYFDLPLRQ